MSANSKTPAHPLPVSNDPELVPDNIRLLPLIIADEDPLSEGFEVLRQIFQQMCAINPALSSVKLVNPDSDLMHYTLSMRGVGPGGALASSSPIPVVEK